MGTSLLSPDAWVRVMKKLDTDDVVRCRAVCRQFHDFSVERVLKTYTKLWILSADIKLWLTIKKRFFQNVWPSRSNDESFLGFDLSAAKTDRKRWIYNDCRSNGNDCFHLDHHVPLKKSIWIDSPLEMEDIEVISRLFPSVSVLKFYQFHDSVKYNPLIASLQLFPNIACFIVNGNSDHKKIMQMEPTDKLIHLKIKNITKDDNKTKLKNVFPSLQSLELDDVDDKTIFPISSPSKRAVLRGSRENSFHWSLFASSLEVIEAVIDFSDYSRKYEPSHPGLHSLTVDITTSEEEQEEDVNLGGLMNFILDNKESLRNLTFSAVNASRDSFESLLASLSLIEKLEITFSSGYILSTIRRHIEEMGNMKHLSLVYNDYQDSAYFVNEICPYLPSDLDNLSIRGMNTSKRFPGEWYSSAIKSMLQSPTGIKQISFGGTHCSWLEEWQEAFDEVDDDDDEDLTNHKFLIRIRKKGFVVTLANEPESEI